MPTPDASQFTQFRRYAAVAEDALTSAGTKISLFNTSYSIPMLSANSQSLFLPSANKDNKVPPVVPLSTVERMRSFFASTGLSDSEITSLCSYLGPTNAVVFGSAPLYAYKGVTSMNGVPVGDIDILCASDGVSHSAIENLLVSAGFSVVNVITPNFGLDSGSIMPGKDWSMVSSSTYVSGPTNPIVFDPASPAVGPPSHEALIYGDSDLKRKYRFDYLNTKQYQKNSGTIIQLLPGGTNLPALTNLSDVMAMDADFTVAAGTFDGTSVITPYPSDVDTMKTVYRDLSLERFSTSWALYRLKKFIDRGFFIYFNNQIQIDRWNHLINYYPNAPAANADFWYTSVPDAPSRIALSAAGYCPFPLRV